MIVHPYIVETAAFCLLGDGEDILGDRERPRCRQCHAEAHSRARGPGSYLNRSRSEWNSSVIE